MMRTCLERLYNCFIKENPVLALMLGMCPTLARIRPTACVGYGLCVKQRGYGAIALKNSLSRVDHDQRAEKFPVKVIASAAIPAAVSAL